MSNINLKTGPEQGRHKGDRGDNVIPISHLKADAPQPNNKSKKPRRILPRWARGMIANAKGDRTGCLANVLQALRRAPQWRGVLAFDEFALSIELRRAPPYAGEAGWQQRAVQDHDITLTAEWLQKQGVPATVETVRYAVEAVAREHCYHPVRDWLNSLEWDGIERVEQWLPRYYGATDGRYTRAVGRCFLISAVARIMEPGCKADHMIVLEGGQGARKSMSIKALAEPWASDDFPDIASGKDASLQARSAWVHELGELDALSRSETTKVKAFVSRTVDQFRPPYGRAVVKVPRQCVFIGTTNKEDYLKDVTGNRRFWPVATKRCDVEGIRRDRDQLWAEAVHLYRKRTKWWIEDAETAELAAEEAERRVEVDPWEGKVIDYATAHSERDWIPTEEFLTVGIGVQPERQTPAQTQRIGRILTKMRWTRRQRGSRGAQKWGYEPPRK